MRGRLPAHLLEAALWTTDNVPCQREECLYRGADRDLDDSADGVRRHDSLRRTPTAYSARACGDADFPARTAGRLN